MSARTCVTSEEVSVLWDVYLRGFYCIQTFYIRSSCQSSPKYCPGIRQLRHRWVSVMYAEVLVNYVIVGWHQSATSSLGTVVVILLSYTLTQHIVMHGINMVAAITKKLKPLN